MLLFTQWISFFFLLFFFFVFFCIFSLFYSASPCEEFGRLLRDEKYQCQVWISELITALCGGRGGRSRRASLLVRKPFGTAASWSSIGLCSYSHV